MIRVSGKLTPQAFTEITTCPLPALGDSTASMLRLSGGPYCLHRTAFMECASSKNRWLHTYLTTEKSYREQSGDEPGLQTRLIATLFTLYYCERTSSQLLILGQRFLRASEP